MKKEWWHDKVAYQIYPKSFLDTTGNGIGDLRGIIRKLDYLKELGADILWISPCYLSPLADQGYDIADYYRIDPRFGGNEDMEELIREAKRRNMYILLDLVVNHCSDEHEWFQKALQDPDGPYAEYFFFEEGIDGREPNNWRSYFGGSVWERIPGSKKYYLHLFHKKQPDLNWENPGLREEIFTMINWWLDKGIAGFRIDAILNIKKVFPLRGHDFPADREDGRAACTNMIYEARGIGELLREMRDRSFRPHGAFSVGEVFNETEEQIPEFIGAEDGYFSSMFDFRAAIFGHSEKGWYDFGEISPDEYRNACFETQRLVGDRGFVSTIIENHDEPRGVSRYIPEADLSDRSKKFLATMQLMLRGLPFIYQGQELGMENCPVQSIEEVDDISAREEYQLAVSAGLSEEEAIRVLNRYSRDNARTPMQWDATENAGFTAGIPWLPVNPNYRRINAEAELQDEDSVFRYYQKLIRLRKDAEYGDTVVYGAFEPYCPELSGFMSFYRRGEKHTLLVLGNFRAEERLLTLPAECRRLLLTNVREDEYSMEGRELRMAGYQAMVLEL